MSILCSVIGVFTLGDARLCFGLTQTIPPLGSMLNFDADLKIWPRITQCEIHHFLIVLLILRCLAAGMCLGFQYRKAPSNNCQLIHKPAQGGERETFFAQGQVSVYTQKGIFRNKKLLSFVHLTSCNSVKQNNTTKYALWNNHILFLNYLADFCANHGCRNGAQCLADENLYSCHCLVAFTGLQCETATDDCKPNPCSFGGTCHDYEGNDNYSCTCAPGYIGPDCESDIAECHSNPCLNGGGCEDGTDSYSCTCRSGFSGLNCETDINDCIPDPCLNGGTCEDEIDSYSCTCPVEFSGKNCETNTNECSPNPCLNGGTCLGGTGSYFCECTSGFTGPDCETDRDDCVSGPCLNGGTCLDGVDSYTCECDPEFSGLVCETNIAPADPGEDFIVHFCWCGLLEWFSNNLSETFSCPVWM